jgi:DNA-binding transcriptional LysR family regulator
LEHPGVTVHLRAAGTGSSGLARSLVDGEVDVAFLSLVDPPGPGMTARELGSARLVLLVRDDHPLAGLSTVSVAELSGQEFVDSPPGWGNRVLVDRAFAAAGVERRVTVEIANLTAVPEYVHHGLGIAVVPDIDLAHAPDVRAIPLSEVDLRWRLSVATSATRRPSAAVRALLALVDDFLIKP